MHTQSEQAESVDPMDLGDAMLETEQRAPTLRRGIEP